MDEPAYQSNPMSDHGTKCDGFLFVKWVARIEAKEKLAARFEDEREPWTSSENAVVELRS